MQNRSPLVSCEWLSRNLDLPNLIILDATFFLPRQKRNALTEYRQAHLPNAVFFDIDRIADRNNPLPHSLPSTDFFAAEIGKLGIDRNSRIIVYDGNAFFASARVWWIFRVFGHERIQVLNGGRKRWLQLGLPLESRIPDLPEKIYRARHREQLACDLKRMRTLQRDRSAQILDTRSADSFAGNRPVDDPTLEAGHIPDSINLCYTELTDPKQHTLLSDGQLATLFNRVNIDLQRPIVTTCGSGVSAAVLALALHQLGKIDVSVYDGSWAEWGRQQDTPKQRGAA